MELLSRLFRNPTGSFFLFGPRGTGKSTWLRNHRSHAVWLDLLDPESQRMYQARPERLKELIAGQPQLKDVVIDEIQKVPALLDVVHELVESDKNLRFVLTGSSVRKLRRGSWNLLAGRLGIANMHPFMAIELGESFDLQKSLEMGLVPLIWNSDNPEQTKRAYASLYLHEEVQAEALVRNVGAFARFMEAISFSHGSLLNLSQVARECHVGRKTVEGYLNIVYDLLLAFHIPVFTCRAKRHLVAHDKFYYFDTGVFRSLRPAGPLDRLEEIEGAALEGLVAQHLRAWIDYHPSDVKLYYWRTKSGSEVDFVVYGKDVFFAIEVKRSATVYKKDLRALRTFKDDYPEASVSLLYMGKERLMIHGIPCIPCEEFLKELNPKEQKVPI
ncbi:MAG: ATP-binding protein [Candidatus Marinimicrobia bacterium]|nr:ATP-binding protein [Candidatus Neomarinimicrobiota bacterium]MBL7030902.1 ATP-binding protein [Candidatus Neomarinimicrobiota bacterium]